MLSRIKLSLPEIKKALLDIDDEKLGIDDLKALCKHVPTQEEVRYPHLSFNGPSNVFRLGGFRSLEI
jgi:hypothetical protein